jgi:drug/metabolite transporter (DMT)-like permease
VAIGFMLLCSALLALTTLIAKALGQGASGPPLHPLEVSAARFGFGFLALLPVALWRRPSFRGAAWPVHLGRSLCGWAGVSCLFAAAALMPLADATAISFLAPLFTMLLAIPLLGERVGPWRFGAAAVALAGGLIIVRPGAEAFQPAALIALASALFTGLEAILIKRLARGEPLLRILVINNGIGATVALGAVAWVWTPPTPAQWLLMAALGTCMVLAQVCFLQALKRADASFVVPFFYATLVFAALYDLAVFGVVPLAGSILGAALIMLGALTLAWRERHHQRCPGGRKRGK